MLLSISSALSWSFFHQLSRRMPPIAGDAPGCERFVTAQVRNLPDYLRLAFAALALGLNLVSLFTGRGLFCRVHPDVRERVMARWNKIPGPGREFLLFYKTLAAFYLFSFLTETENVCLR
jgi:hypothetical protein